VGNAVERALSSIFPDREHDPESYLIAVLNALKHERPVIRYAAATELCVELSSLGAPKRYESWNAEKSKSFALRIGRELMLQAAHDGMTMKTTIREMLDNPFDLETEPLLAPSRPRMLFTVKDILRLLLHDPDDGVRTMATQILSDMSN
jgi:hypothetical protein